MLVSLYPAISNNNKSKVQSFKANPLIDISKINSEAQAYHLRRVIDKIKKTPEEETVLNSTIQRCIKEGQITVAAILSEAKSKWPLPQVK